MQNLDKQWLFSDAIFEYRKSFTIDDYNTDWWVDHIHFAYDLIVNLKPKCVVELGTYRGNSLFAMAQAIKDKALDTELCAVDTWKGDIHIGDYGEEIYQNVVNQMTNHYPKQKIKLFRKTFKEAVLDFQHHSIDLLHIDGTHTYEAVSDDYHTWKDRVKEDGVIMFHDTLSSMGVLKFWEELQEEHPEYIYLEFKYCGGLGVVFKSNVVQKYIHWDAKDYFEKLYFWKAKSYYFSERPELKAQQQVEQTVNFYTQSKSWKITAPLRKIASLLR